MTLDGLRRFWEMWEQTVLTFLAIVIVGVSSYMFGLAHNSQPGEALRIMSTEGHNTVLCSAQCDTLGVMGDDADDVSASQIETAVSDDHNSQIGTVDQKTPACMFVGSVNGSKYYPLDCAAINRIKKENLICFSSASDAQTKGYSHTKAC